MVNASFRWINNVSGVYLVQVFWLLIGQQGLRHYRYRPFFTNTGGKRHGTFLQVSALASHWLENCANSVPTPEENYQYM